MNRRSFIASLSILGLGSITPTNKPASAAGFFSSAQADDRVYWARLLYSIAYPVCFHLSKNTLKQQMPVEVNTQFSHATERARYTHLEAVGRTLSGVAPWLRVEGLTGEELNMRDHLRSMIWEGLTHIADPAAPDYLNFHQGEQPLVDGAFLSLAFLRAWNVLWEPLDNTTQKRIIQAIQSQRVIQPPASNWLLFASINEAFLLQAGEKPDLQRLWRGVQAFKEWYLGDGWYGDGPELHVDYYNAYVIHPFLLQIYDVLLQHQMVNSEEYHQIVVRMQRYGEEQERFISPEGTYPPIGRSIAYRIGAFHALADLALRHLLPTSLSPAQVRCALTAVMKKQFEASGTFDQQGWLQIGFCGHQPQAANVYISTGSLYLCTHGFLPLGLPPDDAFWKQPDADWTAKRAWTGTTFQADHAL
ncbi:MAG: DUF2264 domain-containing protein [Thermoflavifilum sp.]|nr:DUF2264 domain-containing protein [Thermoflavifilum sp.]